MRVKRSAGLLVESSQGDSVYVRERSTGTRAALNHATLELLNRLDEPHDVPDRPAIRKLLELGLLVEEGHENRHARDKTLVRVAPTLFACPAWSTGERADFTVLGVPHDAGNLTAPGARFGPGALRRASGAYASRASLERPGLLQPWLDSDSGDEMLGGARLCDAGDVYLPAGESAERTSGRITWAVAELAAAGGRPVLLGGDHSISFAALRALAGPGTGLLHFDAHSDSAPHVTGRAHDYGNVVTRILAELDVACVLHVGLRGPVHGRVHWPPRRLALSSSQVRAHGAPMLLAQADPALRWYVSIDIDVLDPAWAPGTATPVPGGLAAGELKALLRTFGRARQVIGCDLVEVNPTCDHNAVTALLGCELLLAFLGAVWEAQA